MTLSWVCVQGDLRLDLVDVHHRDPGISNAGADTPSCPPRADACSAAELRGLIVKSTSDVWLCN